MKSLIMLLIPIFLFGCGKDGEQGPQGEQGIKGEQGINGINGSKIYSGKSVPSATVGVNGDLFLNLSNGDLYGPKTSNGWGQPFNLKGDQGNPGTPGSPGATILSGQTTPTLSIGKNGDFYINLKEMVIYGPKISSSWGTPVSLKSDTENGVSVYVIKPDWNKNLVKVEGTNPKTFTTVSEEYTVPAASNNYLAFYTAASDENNTLQADISLINWRQLERTFTKYYFTIPSIQLDLHIHLKDVQFEATKTTTGNVNPKYKFTMAGTYSNDNGTIGFHNSAVWIMIKSYNYQEIKAKTANGLAIDTNRFLRLK